MTRYIQTLLDNYGEDLLLADGFEDAIIGICHSSNRVIYSVKKCIDILSQEMDTEDALEHFYYNVAGGYVGEQTPIWCEDMYLDT
jgi:hypothetical protein